MTCLWISCCETSMVTSPPSPTNAHRPHRDVARTASERPAALPEQSTVVVHPAPAVSSSTPLERAVVGRQGVVDQAEPSARARRPSARSMPTTGPAPRARASIAAASPTGPRPVTSSAVGAGHLETSQRLPGGAEAAGDERSVDEAQPVGQRQAAALLRQQVVGVAAVALPAVGLTARVGAPDLVAGAALLALRRSRRCGRPRRGPRATRRDSPARRRRPLRRARARRPRRGRPPLRARGARGRWPGCRCRRSRRRAWPAAPARARVGHGHGDVLDRAVAREHDATHVSARSGRRSPPLPCLERGAGAVGVQRVEGGEVVLGEARSGRAGRRRGRGPRGRRAAPRAAARARSITWSRRRSTTSIGVALLVDALGVAGPGGDDERGAAYLAVVRELVLDHRHQPLGDPVGALRAQPREGVLDLGVGEPLDRAGACSRRGRRPAPAPAWACASWSM